MSEQEQEQDDYRLISITLGTGKRYIACKNTEHSDMCGYGDSDTNAVLLPVQFPYCDLDSAYWRIVPCRGGTKLRVEDDYVKIVEYWSSKD